MVNIKNRLKGLHYKDDDTFHPLPPWCEFYISLGQMISRSISQDTQLVISLAVPSRTYCASLISLGFIAGRADLPEQMNYSVHAEYLKSLPQGTPVVLRSQLGKRFRGIYKGCVKRIGRTYFIVKTDEKNSTERYVQIKDSGKIEVLDEQAIKLPQTQKGRSISPSSEFSISLLGKEYTHSLVSYTQLEVAIIGSKKWLKKEIAEEIFATRAKKSGVLQDVLRAREFQSSSAAYRLIVISDRIKFVPVHSMTPDPPLTIFDGCQGFLKWRNFWRGSNWVIVLDRTENQYEPAIAQLTKEYIERRVDKPSNLALSNIPKGIEIMVFEVLQ